MTSPLGPILPLSEQAALRNAWLRRRLETVLPELMARAGLDMWLVVAREYNEDPVLMTLIPEPEMSARRRTILVFARRGDGLVERLTIGRYGYGGVGPQDAGLYTSVWDPDAEPQDACLRRVVAERDPARIGVNVSATFAFADGLSHHEHERLVAALGPELSVRLVGAEDLAVGWLERRTEEELAAYGGIVAMGHRLIARAFSREVIAPGRTTVGEVEWWLRQAMHDHGLRAWFQPNVEIQAPGLSFEAAPGLGTPRTAIEPGDLLWVDVGFSYLGLCTDHQQHAYVLREGEADAPAGLRAALAAGNRLQDILLGEMRPGRTGNAVLLAARERALAEGLQPSIYTHPLGYHGHAAGPTIGLWDRQGGVPGGGDYPLYDGTVYSIELNVRQAVPEWGDQEVRIALEEDAALVGGAMRWLDGRQEALILI
ncbi:MAG TPA: M24 family metallopeptidase [Chloroflexaceae bacterium]|nr:M24 family metallopeptidase [Chloroflexaceae bacterium]